LRKDEINLSKDAVLNIPPSTQQSTPVRSTGFKFNKSKKENQQLNQSSSPSLTSTPRKKQEKLNYKSGIDILELYKSKNPDLILLCTKSIKSPDLKISTSSSKLSPFNLDGKIKF
jgi:uncharacterized LabA/DUF88 family protein